MSSSSSTLAAISVVSFLLLFQIVVGAEPLFHFCSNSGNFTTSSPYEQNLNQLLGQLSYKTQPTGFGMESVGQYQAQTFGLSLCRGDVSSKDCLACVVDASVEIRKRCPSNKVAVIWYDNCLLRYSNTNFFGKIDNENKFYMWNLNNVSDPESFNTNTKRLLSGLSEKASKDSKLYATGELDLEGTRKLYGLVQCTRDLSSVACKTCLDDAVSNLPNCCNGKEGGRVVGGSCNIRYEIYPFVSS